ncbi:MAG TPA: pilus assembly protein PilN [Porticoccaceae bacterium]|nr:pilus assembly protein PilN [Porticoccaceae bacterium]HCO59277.1 pilus assembly protein PilN [Porticoccaceae bacterium]
MANVNLLPWREEYRQEKRKEFAATVVVVLLLGLLSVFVWDRLVNGRIDWQNSRNDLLNREIAILDKKVEEISQLKLRRQQMIDRMEVILALQSNRADIVKIYDQFVRATPDGVYFTEMVRKAANVSLVGYAESISRVSVLMRELEAVDMFKDPVLTKVEADEMLGEQGSRFELQVKIAQSQNVREEVAHGS